MQQQPTDADAVKQATADIANLHNLDKDKIQNVTEAVTTQVEIAAQQAREKEIKLDKDVLIAEIAGFAGGAAVASTPTGGPFLV